MYSKAQAMADNLHAAFNHFKAMQFALMAMEISAFNEHHDKAEALLEDVQNMLDADQSNQLAGAIKRELGTSETGQILAAMSEAEAPDFSEEFAAMKEIPDVPADVVALLDKFAPFMTSLHTLAVALYK